MAGYAVDDRGREFVSVFTVEERTNFVSGISAYDMTYSISGRQKRSKQVDTKSQGVNPSMLASEISIADLLDAVKSTYRSILPGYVLEKSEKQRTRTAITLAVFGTPTLARTRTMLTWMPWHAPRR